MTTFKGQFQGEQKQKTILQVQKMRWFKIAASLLMVSSSLTANPVLAQGSLSHNLRRQTAEKTPNQSTENGAIQLAQNSGIGQIRVIYREGTDDRSRQYINAFRESGAFDNFAEALGNAYYLPQDLTISFQTCGGTANAYYNPVSREVVMCMDLIWDAKKIFEEENYFSNSDNSGNVNDAMELGIFKMMETMVGGGDSENPEIDVFLFVLFHELGHALIDILDIPILGGHENAADNFAAMLILDGENEQFKQRLISSTMDWFYFYEQRKADEQPAYWGTHNLGQQRMYNILCLAYGSNSQMFNSLGTAVRLLKDRANQCETEYNTLKEDWEQIMEPHWRNRTSSNNSSPNTNSGQGSNNSDSNRVW